MKESCKAYQLVREAAELAAWITEKENMMVGEEVGEDLEQVEEMQKKFDDFQKVGDRLSGLCFFFGMVGGQCWEVDTVWVDFLFVFGVVGDQRWQVVTVWVAHKLHPFETKSNLM